MLRDIIKHLVFGLLWGWWFCYLFEPTETFEIVLYVGLPLLCFSFFYNREKKATFWGIPFSLPAEDNSHRKEIEKRETIKTIKGLYRRSGDIQFPKEIEEQYAAQPRATIMLRKSLVIIKKASKEGGRRVGALMLPFRFEKN